eukprot:scaffold20512_cov56-Phaeocystis_antarctica.AAC.3
MCGRLGPTEYGTTTMALRTMALYLLWLHLQVFAVDAHRLGRVAQGVVRLTLAQGLAQPVGLAQPGEGEGVGVRVGVRVRSGLGLGLGLTRPWRQGTCYSLLTMAYQAVATLLTTDCSPGRGDSTHYSLLTAYQAVATLLTSYYGVPGRGDVVQSEVRVRGVLWVVDPRQPRQVDAAWEG